MLSSTHGLEIALSLSTPFGSIAQLAGLMCQLTARPTKDFQQGDFWGMGWLVDILLQAFIKCFGKLLN